MKAAWTFTLGLLLSTTMLLSQYQNGADFLPVKVGDKYGYINSEGDIVIEPQFDWADRFSEGLAAIRTGDDNLGYNGKYGYINPQGEVVIEPNFMSAGSFSNGWARVKQDREGFVYIDKTGQMPIQKKFVECYSVNEFPIPVRISRKDMAGYVDKTGEYVIQPQFNMARPFVNGYAVVAVGRAMGYINKEGNFLIEPKFYRANYFQDGLARVTLRDPETRKKTEGFIDHTGEFVIPANYKLGCASDFSNGLAAVSTDGQKWGYIDTKGNVVIEPKFERAGIFEGGAAKAKLKGKYGIIDRTGKWLIKPKYDNISTFQNGVASVFLKNERMGYINTRGKYVWKAKKVKKKKGDNLFYDEYDKKERKMWKKMEKRKKKKERD